MGKEFCIQMFFHLSFNRHIINNSYFCNLYYHALFVRNYIYMNSFDIDYISNNILFGNDTLTLDADAMHGV